MDRGIFGKVARARFTFPMLGVVAAAALIVNELAHTGNVDATAREARIVDARVNILRVYQLAATAGVGAQSFVESRSTTDATQFEGFARMYETLAPRAFADLITVDPTQAAFYQRLHDSVDGRMAKIARWVQLASDGRADEARGEIADEQVSSVRASLRQDLELAVARIEGIHSSIRAATQRNQNVSRWALHAMILIASLAVYYFLRQLNALAQWRAREQERLQREVEARTAELRELAGYLTNAQENERRRLANELHDELGALLTASKLELMRVRRSSGATPELLERLSGLEKQINKGIALKRNIIENLRPSALDHLGLQQSLMILCENASATMEIPVNCAFGDVELACEAQLAVYRLVQEALTNVGKYAHASVVDVTLTQDAQGVHVMVRDDGAGFDPAAVKAGHHGLIGMRVRMESHGGTLRIDSRPGGGATIRARLPAWVEPMAPTEGEAPINAPNSAPSPA